MGCHCILSNVLCLEKTGKVFWWVFGQLYRGIVAILPQSYSTDLLRRPQKFDLSFTYNLTLLKVAFFRKYNAFFSLPKKCGKNYPEKNILKLRSDSNCTAVSKGGKI